jgi:LPS sulfotransferase NodH
MTTSDKNAKATAFYAAAETATLIADFALDMLAAAHRTGMDTMTLTYETLRANTIARIIEASDAMDIIGKPEAKDAYLVAQATNGSSSGNLRASMIS